MAYHITFLTGSDPYEIEAPTFSAMVETIVDTATADLQPMSIVDEKGNQVAADVVAHAVKERLTTGW